MYARTNKLTGWFIGIAMTALFVGGFFGPLQKLEYVEKLTGFRPYTYLTSIGIKSYYQGLTLHGVLNALVWTTFFICGFLTFATVYSLRKELSKPIISTISLAVMFIGLLMAGIPILMNLATVLFTFYPPLQASPFFYIGLTLVVVGSWITGISLYVTYAEWRKENPGQTTPLIAFGSILTMVMWQIATFGIAVEMLVLIIPWSLGLVEATDPQLARTLFWFTGHPIVYFWLLPAYVAWYGMVPKQVGGKLFSEPLARLVFWLFLILSTPVGFHHQYTDPGVPAGWKVLHAVFTYSLFIPSMITAFTIIASMEIGGRARGGKGLLGWIPKLPWGDPSFVAQNFAMILFAFGGISGLTNSSYNLNLAVHNTGWISGHFHLTVGSAVTLTFFGIAYWLVPKLSGKPLFSRKMGLWQAWTWLIGMLMMSNSLHILGLNFSIPRRTMLGAAPYFSTDWNPLLIEAMIGGLILGISGLLFYGNILATVFSKKRLEQPIEMPVAEPLDAQPIPAWLDTWKPWIVGAIVLVVIAYGPMLIYFFSNAATRWTSPGFNGLW